MASFFPFQTTYYLNGHSFMEQELNKLRIGFRKHRKLDYWTLISGPKFSQKERFAMNLSRFYAINQIEYCRNFIFKRHFPIHKLFVRSRSTAITLPRLLERFPQTVREILYLRAQRDLLEQPE